MNSYKQGYFLVKYNIEYLLFNISLLKVYSSWPVVEAVVSTAGGKVLIEICTVCCLLVPSSVSLGGTPESETEK